MVRLRGWRTIRSLSWRDRWILAQALVLLPLTAAALHAISFSRLHSTLARLLPQPSATPSVDRLQMTAGLVRIAARRGLLSVSCLPHSLVLWWLLRRQRAGAVLRVGVRKTDRQLEAHAWVEHGGVVLNDHDDVLGRYAAFDRALAR